MVRTPASLVFEREVEGVEMGRGLVSLAIASLVVLVSTFPGTATAGPFLQQGSYEFKLGFELLADQIPEVVGQPLENEHHSTGNGDALQATSNGLMVWRKADNWTAFTDGYRTWVNGPNGIEQRLNSERFNWEGDLQLVGTVWEWQRLWMNDGTVMTPRDPSSYTMELLASGQVRLRADFNQGSGSFDSPLDGLITIRVGAITLIGCPPGSLESEYLKGLGEVSSYFFDNGRLILELKFDSGGMMFAPRAS